jgi:hypothetical protein
MSVAEMRPGSPMTRANECGYCHRPHPHRPYAATNRKERVPSSTAVAELVDDGKSSSFAWSASLIASVTAVHHSEDWAGLVGVQSDRSVANGFTDQCTGDKDGLCKACTYLRSEHDRQWTAKADLGTHVHHLVESLIHGEDVEQDEVTEPYLDAFERFVTVCDPVWTVTEATVVYDTAKSHMYRGSLDGICTLSDPSTGERSRWLIDWKTGGYYPASQALQLSSYRYASAVTDWSSGVEVKVGPVPKVDTGGVVLLGADGLFRLAELPVTATTHGTFLRLVDVWHWHTQMKKWAKEHPAVVAAAELEEAVA